MFRAIIHTCLLPQFSREFTSLEEAINFAQNATMQNPRNSWEITDGNTLVVECKDNKISQYLFE